MSLYVPLHCTLLPLSFSICALFLSLLTPLLIFQLLALSCLVSLTIFSFSFLKCNVMSKFLNLLTPLSPYISSPCILLALLSYSSASSSSFLFPILCIPLSLLSLFIFSSCINLLRNLFPHVSVPCVQLPFHFLHFLFFWLRDLSKASSYVIVLSCLSSPRLHHLHLLNPSSYLCPLYPVAITVCHLLIFLTLLIVLFTRFRSLDSPNLSFTPSFLNFFWVF